MNNGTLLARKCSNLRLISLTNFEGLKVKFRFADAFPQLRWWPSVPTPSSGLTKRRPDDERLSCVLGLCTLQSVCHLLTPESDFY